MASILNALCFIKLEHNEFREEIEFDTTIQIVICKLLLSSHCRIKPQTCLLPGCFDFHSAFGTSLTRAIILQREETAVGVSLKLA